MAFPNLVRKTGGTLWSEATGLPVNGANTFNLDLPTTHVDTNWLYIDVYPNGPSITGAVFTSLSVDKTQITVTFVQTGADTARVVARMIHSIER